MLVLLLYLVLDVFTQLQEKTIINFITSIRPSVRPPACLLFASNSSPNGLIFMKFVISGFYENLKRKLKIYENLSRITGTVYEDVMYIHDNISQFFLE